MAHALWKNLLKLDAAIHLPGLSKGEELLFELYTHMPSPEVKQMIDVLQLPMALGWFFM